MNSVRAVGRVAGALMPNAHMGYGMPIRGMLATENAVIPYAVGVDIARRMKLTGYDCKVNTIVGAHDRLANIIENETRFGVGGELKQRREHDVMDDDWGVSPVTQRLRDKAWSQLEAATTSAGAAARSFQRRAGRILGSLPCLRHAFIDTPTSA